MKKLSLIFLAAFFAFSARAAETVRLRDDIDLSVSASTTGTLSLNVEEPSGDATAEAAPAKVYIPIRNTGAVSPSNDSYYLYSNAGSPQLIDASNTSNVVNFPVRINTMGTDLYLYAAVKDTTDSNKYKVIRRYSASPFSQNTSNADITFPVAPADICAVVISECSSLIPSSATLVEKAFTVYLFLSNQSSYGASQEVDVSTSPLNNGIYFSMVMSNRIYPDASLRITITNSRVGDKRLILAYSASNTINTTYAKSVRVYKHSTSSPGATNEPIGDYSGALLEREYPYAQNGEVTATDLPNGQATTLSVLFVDKFLLATTLSQEVTGTPLEIQELLKKNSCFLLTAGFGEDHFVINYFRHFRDTVLMHSSLGKKFVHFYYGLAPKYALELYQHESLRKGVRIFAYGLYYVFNFYPYVILVLLSLGGVLLFKKQRLHSSVD